MSLGTIRHRWWALIGVSRVQRSWQRQRAAASEKTNAVRDWWRCLVIALVDGRLTSGARGAPMSVATSTWRRWDATFRLGRSALSAHPPPLSPARTSRRARASTRSKAAIGTTRSQRLDRVAGRSLVSPRTSTSHWSPLAHPIPSPHRGTLNPSWGGLLPPSRVSPRCRGLSLTSPGTLSRPVPVPVPSPDLCPEVDSGDPRTLLVGVTSRELAPACRPTGRDSSQTPLTQ